MAVEASKPSPPAQLASARTSAVESAPASDRHSLNGVLLLVPILAILALAGISLAVAGIFSIGFWAAFGWTTLAVAGALLLALAVAILRGK